MFNLDSEAFLTLLKAFVPYDWVQWTINITVFIIIPAIVIYFSIQVVKRIYEPKAIGAWRTAGNFWFNLMLINLVVAFLLFCMTVYWAGNKTSLNSKYEGLYRKNFLVDNSKKLDLKMYAQEHAVNKNKPNAIKLITTFYNDYAIIHYLPWLTFDILVVSWLFLPGIKMRKQRIKF